ncbi:MAG: hypothetical protein MZV64_42885 [Ignavibacteriales bacterium]|nr:hypothetical protein [Ignavibacteriales bacterium]
MHLLSGRAPCPATFNVPPGDDRGGHRRMVPLYRGADWRPDDRVDQGVPRCRDGVRPPRRHHPDERQVRQHVRRRRRARAGGHEPAGLPPGAVARQGGRPARESARQRLHDRETRGEEAHLPGALVSRRRLPGLVELSLEIPESMPHFVREG